MNYKSRELAQFRLRVAKRRLVSQLSCIIKRYSGRNEGYYVLVHSCSGDLVYSKNTAFTTRVDDIIYMCVQC